MKFEKWLQSRLTAHGFPCGPIDGIVGELTVAAIKAFEKHHGFPVNGTADEAVVKGLRAHARPATPLEQSEIPNRKPPIQSPPGPPTSPWPRQKDVYKFYGRVGQNQTRVPIPFDMYLAWDTSYRIRSMTLHKRVAASAERVLNKIVDVYTEADRKALGLHLFGGSLNVRKMRGGSRYSMHSWGIAIDFDPVRNQLSWHKPKARLSHPDALPFWHAWEDEGWLSLGRERDFDWMHVQAARL